MLVRHGVADDLPRILAIYNHAVATDVATFDLDPVTVDERRDWLAGFGAEHPLLVCTEADALLGYAYYTTYRARPGYAATKETSIYVAPDARARGVATQLYTRLIEHARERGVHTLLAVLGGDNPASVALHRKLGFTLAGHLREVGFKFGGWVDTYYYQKLL